MPVLVGSEPPVVQTKAFPLAINFELFATADSRIFLHFLTNAPENNLSKKS